LRKTALAAYEELSILGKCPECNGRLVAAGGDEKVCSSCGIVFGRTESVQYSSGPAARREPLGSYVINGSEGFGQTGLNPNSVGLDRVALSCCGLIERACGRMMLPRSVIENALRTARRLLPGRKTYRATVPAICAYALLYACRSAGITHIGYREILQTCSDAGHKVSKAQLLRIGMESSLPLPRSSPEELVRAVVRKLQANEEVAERLNHAALDPQAYYVRLFELAKNIAASSPITGGLNPKTVAAGSVYLANLSISPKIVRQREAAETVGMAEYTIREYCVRARKQAETR